MSTAIAATSPAAASSSSIVDEAHAPAAVREGSKTVKQAYASAQGFEEMLLQQLSQEMLQSSGLGGEGSSEGEAGSGGEGGSAESGGGALASLLPQALTEGVMREGGLGLATQLMHSLDPAAGIGATGASATGAGASSAGTTGASATGGTTAGETAAARATNSGEPASAQSAGSGEAAAASSTGGAAAPAGSVQSTGGVSA